MRMTRDELETENARLQGAVAELSEENAQLKAGLEIAQGMADEANKMLEGRDSVVGTLRDQNKELVFEVRDMGRRLRAAEEALVPLKESLHRCLGWIACQQGKGPLDDGMPF